MFTTHWMEMFRIGAAASDVGVVDWMKTAALSGTLALFVRFTIAKLTHGLAS